MPQPSLSWLHRFLVFHTSGKPLRPFQGLAQTIKCPALVNPLGPLGDVYVSKEPLRLLLGATGRRSLPLSRGCPRPPSERDALLPHLVSAEEYKTKYLTGSAVLMPPGNLPGLLGDPSCQTHPPQDPWARSGWWKMVSRPRKPPPRHVLPEEVLPRWPISSEKPF